MDAFTTHYANLFSALPELDTTDIAFWHERLHLAQREEIPLINEDLTWAEICDHVSNMKSYKATGPSNLPVAWFKLACDNRDSTTKMFPATPASPMGRILFQMCAAMFATSSIPEKLTSAFIVSIFKSGDKTDLNNYRGISLIDSILKIVTGVITRRLQASIAALPASQGLVMMQAGFRPGEECVGHAAALMEICQRRRAWGEGGKNTYLAFLDLQKAFDRVPHGALLYKLHQFGVRGRTLHFFQALYSSSNGMVRDHEGGKHGPVVNLTRGVRQGCPSSPLMFNIFINDIFDNVQYGVNVPYTSRAGNVPCKYPGYPGLVFADENVVKMAKRVPSASKAGKAANQFRCPGLLFADDSVVMAESMCDLKSNLTAVQNWAARNGMAFNASKSGIMLVCGKYSRKYPALADEAKACLEKKVEESYFPTFGGESVAIVEEYKYLGVMFNSELDAKRMATYRCSKAKKPLSAIQGFVASSAYPLCAKIPLIKNVAYPITMYGSEVFGGCESHVMSLTSVFNNAIRGMTLSWGRSAASLLRRELGLFSVHATAVAAHARAYFKYLTNSRTMINTLLARPFIAPACWSTNTMTMLKRHGITIPEEMQAKPAAVFHYVRAEVEAKEMGKKKNADTKTAKYYNDNEFGKTRNFVGKFAAKRCAAPALDMGVAGLIAARTGGMWLGHRA
ncbi:MAG TPA: reverse transcriptase family protein, partial [Thiobacillus sp.]|nr:reverse transcriptase family protein [Thiobacillus sp.]